MSFTSGGLTYQGGAADPWREIVGAEIDADPYGLDSLNREYEVRPDSVEAFLNAFPKEQEDATYPWLYVVSAKCGVTGVPLKGSVMFKGARLPAGQNPKLPRNVQKKGGLVMRQVTLQSLLNPQFNKDVTYRTAYAEWKYVTTINPELLGPVFTGKLLQKPGFEVMTTTGAVGGIFINPDYIVQPGQQPPAPATPTADADIQFNGLLKISPSKFDFDQVGAVWQVIERNELLIVDYGTFVINGYR